MAFVLIPALFLLGIFLSLWFSPRNRRLRRVRRILRSYIRLRRANPGREEKEIWNLVSAGHFPRTGAGSLDSASLRAAVTTACEDFCARQDIIRSEKTAALELARRILVLEGTRAGSSLNIEEMEEIYRIVETASGKVFPRK